MRKHFSEELKSVIINRKLNGESAYDLAKEYNIGASTIYKWIRLSYGSIVNVNAKVSHYVGAKVSHLLIT